MPIPHEVTKEFFVPTEDLPFFDPPTNQNDPGQMQQRVNDLLYLFNLLDTAFGRRNNQNENNSPPPPEVPHTESQSDETTSPIDNDDKDMDSSNDEATEESNNESESESSHEQQTEETEDASAETNLPNLNELDMLTLQLLLMRQRLNRQRRRIDQFTNTTENNN